MCAFYIQSLLKSHIYQKITRLIVISIFSEANIIFDNISKACRHLHRSRPQCTVHQDFYIWTSIIRSSWNVYNPWDNTDRTTFPLHISIWFHSDRFCRNVCRGIRPSLIKRALATLLLFVVINKNAFEKKRFMLYWARRFCSVCLFWIFLMSKVKCF